MKEFFGKQIVLSVILITVVVILIVSIIFLLISKYSSINSPDFYYTRPEVSLCQETAEEGFVLMANRNHSLPIPKDKVKSVALFGGCGAMRTAKSGTAAGDTKSDYVTSIYQGLKNAGYKITSEKWLQAFDTQYAEELAQWEFTVWGHFKIEEPLLTDDDIQEASADTDTAIYVIRRISGEGTDRVNEKGDYQLSETEYANLKKIGGSFDNVIVILNTCGVIDTKFFDEISGLDSLLFVSLGGMDIGDAVANVISGKVTPSGKLTDTWAKNYEDYPSSANFGTCNVNYYEDIYVGYRYFETFTEARDKVNYCFGHGLSYTKFNIACKQFSYGQDGTVTVTLEVKNTGDYAGKEVVQIYYDAPSGMLGKAAKSLIAFQKTKLLLPGETQTIVFTLHQNDMASYDDTGKTDYKAAYVLEAGEYKVYVGNSVRNAGENMAGSFYIPQTVCVEQLSTLCSPVDLKERLISNGSGQILTESLEDQIFEVHDDHEEFLNKEIIGTGSEFLDFYDVYKNPTLLDNFIAQLTNEELVDLAQDKDPNIGSGNIGDLGKYNIPAAISADGAAGLHVGSKIAWPCPTLMASTWNIELLYKIGESIGTEGKNAGVDFWLAPGLNIHRNPLCGRNIEYYSEDPLLSGIVASEVTKGVQSQRVSVVIKHFAGNEQETDRGESDSRISERALREIYLKSFEIAVKAGNAWAVMTSYNSINGVDTAEYGDLINGILRGEWGFKGLVMTDWGNGSTPYLEVLAGHDIRMGSPNNTINLDALARGYITRGQLQQNIKRILSTMLKTNVMERNSRSVEYTNLSCETISTFTTGETTLHLKSTVTNTYTVTLSIDGNKSGTQDFSLMSGEVVLSSDYTSEYDAAADKTKLIFPKVVIPHGLHQLCLNIKHALHCVEFIPLKRPLAIASVPEEIQKSVDFGTSFERLSLPTQVEITLTDGTSLECNVVWNTNSYNRHRAGIQQLVGELELPAFIDNPQNQKISAEIIVSDSSSQITGIFISTPNNTKLIRGEQLQLTATVEGLDSFSEEIIWKTSSSRSTISPEGILTIGQDECDNVITVTACAADNTNYSDTITITVKDTFKKILSEGETRIRLIDYDQASSNFSKENCNDVDSSSNLTNLTGGQWVEFNIVVEKSGIYSIDFRYASPVDSAGPINILIDGSHSASAEGMKITGGWQIWGTHTIDQIFLPAGEHILRLDCQGHSYNLNWIRIYK